jgi:hypothetical protein
VPSGDGDAERAPAPDPVVERRRRVATIVGAAKRLGYSLWAVSIVLFFVLFFTDFDGPMVAVVVGCLLAGCVVLLPAIVLGYAVRAADREDREQGLT